MKYSIKYDKSIKSYDYEEHRKTQVNAYITILGEEIWIPTNYNNIIRKGYIFKN